MTIVLISDGGAEQHACRLLADRLEQQGQPCLTIGAPATGWHSPWPAVRPQLEIPADALLGTTLLEEATAIGLFLQDTDQLDRLVHGYRELCRYRGRKPAPVFSGPLAPVVGDKLISELSSRHRCDLVLLHGERQRQEAAAMRFNWPASLKAPPLVCGGFWFMPERPHLGCLSGGLSTPPYSLLVLAQQTIPTQIGAKSQMLRQLIRWAEASPQWHVVIQRDHAWNNDEPWIPFYEPEDWTLPPNLGFGEPGQMLTLLSNCTACAGVSSPWLFTAMAWGRRAMVIGDFGIHSSQGTSGFFGSGAMHRLRSIHHLDQLLDLPKPSQSWLESMGWAVHDGPVRLHRALKEITP
ncbi:hypothetical protein SynA15127_02416 [Synechococcus sp. A15-127]|uniref:DUF6716 putative glycosyltransferase n=1 Tax=Synechococcus sp. A15-127 TaxID=1050624 RepID=UPI001645FAF5|nr:DUF6716 putative glycosyltransferase [Synechococcus sp. A15-127]QNI95480.1 hypothetical protein SynA15127_02416 [Synechococcus sp. A15-127]